TANFLKENGIRTKIRKKISEGNTEILDALKQGHITYVINTQSHNGDPHDGIQIRRGAVENNVTMFTSLDTVTVLLDVLEEITVGVSTIDM
ncbi:MAG: carbamoyl-phosphate synthase large subunit, partial [Clostridia bacterium]|nr:carbamoyl-phosphate synthase large subunit [Clostridia bacterium]